MAVQGFLLAHITTEYSRNKVPHGTERILVGEFAVMVVVLERKEVALVIVYEAIEYRRFPMHRKISDLDREDYIREAVCPKRRTVFFEVAYAGRDAVIGYLRVMERNAAVLIENVEAKLEIGQNSFIRVLAIDKAQIDLLIDRGRVDGARVSVDRRDLVHLIRGDASQLFQHSLRRIIQVGVVEAALIRLLFGTLVDRVDP